MGLGKELRGMPVESVLEVLADEVEAGLPTTHQFIMMAYVPGSNDEPVYMISQDQSPQDVIKALKQQIVVAERNSPAWSEEQREKDLHGQDPEYRKYP